MKTLKRKYGALLSIFGIRYKRKYGALLSIFGIIIILLFLIQAVDGFNYTIFDKECSRLNFKVINSVNPYTIYGDCELTKNIYYCSCDQEIIINSKGSNNIIGDYYIAWNPKLDNSIYLRQFSVTTAGNDPFKFDFGDTSVSKTGSFVAIAFIIMGAILFFAFKYFKKAWDNAEKD